MSLIPNRLLTLLVTVGTLGTASNLSGQVDVIVEGQPVMVQPAPGGAPPQPGKPSSKPGEPPKKGDEGKKDGEKKDSEPTIKVVRRADLPQKEGDQKQFDISPNEEGKLPFNFEGAPWPQVMEWLARVSHLSLDWQELPGDMLNLHTQREYSVPEVQNLINRHLLARGYTMLIEGEMLTVAKTSGINAALVPRVEPDDLSNRQDYEFVKTSFPLEWILAEQAVTELQPMLSSNGKLTALKGVNRIEAMDAVTNLRDIYVMLQREQSEDSAQSFIVKTFKLQHRRAGEVMIYLYDILGLDKGALLSSSGGGGGRMSDGMSMQIMNQLRQMQQMMQQNRGNNNASGSTPAEPRLIVNDRENTILANAPPDKMEIIEQTIKAVDVPGDEAAQFLQNMARMKVYRLTTLQPDPLMEILSELGELSPQSKIKVDSDNKSLIVYGTLADHYTIQSLVDKLDGSNRSFEVIQLRRVRADAVAGTIKYMFGVEDEKKDNNSRRSYYSYYDYYGSSSRTQKEEQRPFKVDADIDKNRLLVWANDLEMEEIRNLLVKMGEMPPGVSNPETLRTFEVDTDEEAEKLLERIRELWPEIQPNELLIRPQRAVEQPAPTKSDEPAKSSVMRQSTAEDDQPLSSAEFSDEPGFTAAPVETETQLNSTARDLELEYLQRQQANSAPPITIQRGKNGRILFGSPDTAALDRLEELLSEIAPPVRDYKIFYLKYPDTWAYGVELNLKDFFKDDAEEQQIRDWWGDVVSVNERGPSRMSSRKPLKIISDADSRTILVQGATPEQLQIIEDLIDVYDQPVSSDPHAIRRTKIFRLRYSKAGTVADTLKQVYRDLLSSNDPALNNNGNKDQKPPQTGGITYVYGNRNNGEEGGDDRSQPEPIRFKGMLSVGVDEISNSIVVSAIDAMMTDIEELITSLDESARPDTTVEILEIKNLDAMLLKQHLESAFGVGASFKTSQTGDRNRNGNNPGPQQNQGNPPQGPNQPVFQNAPSGGD